jgi:hypothetical protein
MTIGQWSPTSDAAPAKINSVVSASCISIIIERCDIPIYATAVANLLQIFEVTFDLRRILARPIRESAVFWSD